MAVLVFNAMVS